MKKEEFLSGLRKSLSVLEEKEIQDIVGEYEQHIDMKIKEGLSEEEAIQDFGDFHELTAGILEAYHVKADYQADKKNIDFGKVKEESRKVTEKAADSLSKGAGAVGKGMGRFGKWGRRQMKRLWGTIKKPFSMLSAKLAESKKKARGKGIFGRIWMMILSLCSLLWSCVKWCMRIVWICFWFVFGCGTGFVTLISIFLIGLLAVLLVEGYPVLGVMIAVIGAGLVSAAFTLFSYAMIKQFSKQNKKDKQNAKKQDGKEENENLVHPQEQEKQMTVKTYQEVLNHA